jgi:capsular polysaccharide biosynthesis protein
MTNGDIANNVARTYGELFRQWRVQQNEPLQLQDRINAELLDTPIFHLVKPTTQTNVLAGALLGVLIGGVIIFLIETLSANIMRRGLDIERYLELPVLGSIPESTGKGV